MLISEVIKELQKIERKHGDMDVMMYAEEGPYLTTYVKFEEVLDDDEWPEDYRMPKGFKYACLKA